MAYQDVGKNLNYYSMKQNKQFDDIVLMQYADGELDDASKLTLEEALLHDKDLRERLKVQLKTRILLLESQLNYSLEMPQQLTNMLDSLEYQARVEKQSQKHKQSNPSIRNWLASLFGSSQSSSAKVNSEGSLTVKRVVSIAFPLAIASAIAFTYITLQQTINELESASNHIKLQQSQNTYSSVSYSNANKSSIDSRLDDLNNHLVASRGELQSYQQKLILTTSKAQILEDEAARMKNARPEVISLKTQLAATEEKLELDTTGSRVSQEKYETLENALIARNRLTVERAMLRIDLLEETAEGVAITTAVAPVLGIAKLIEFTESEIDNYCLEIDELIFSEKEILGEVSVLNKEVLTEYNINCLTVK